MLSLARQWVDTCPLKMYLSAKDLFSASDSFWWFLALYKYVCIYVCLALTALTLLVGRQDWHPSCKTEWWGAGVVICLERGADLRVAQLMSLPLTVSCFSKIQISFTFLVPAHPGIVPGRAVKRVCVYVCMYACILPNTCLGSTRVTYTPIGISIGFIRFRRAYAVRTTRRVWRDGPR